MLAIWLVTGLAVILILVANVPFTGQVTVAEGEVAQRDIVAPRQTTFVSEILTQQRRDMAASVIADIYDPPQARIGRQQLALAGQILTSITTLRGDSAIADANRAAYLKAISGLNLPSEVIDRIVVLPPETWERIAAEVPAVLERAIREEIRENNLADERRKVPARVRWICRMRMRRSSALSCRTCCSPTVSTTRLAQKNAARPPATPWNPSPAPSSATRRFCAPVISSPTWRSRCCRRWACRVEAGRGMTSSQ